MNGNGNEKERKWLGIVTVAIILLLWEFLPKYSFIDKYLFPPPSVVITRGFAIWISEGSFLSDILYSMMHWAIGLCLGFIAGFSLGISMGWYKTVGDIFYYLEELVRPIPPIAWIPAIIAWLKFTDVAAGMIIFIGGFFPVLINSYSGARNVERILVDAAKTLGTKNMLRKVVIPYSMPFTLTGLRIAVAACWMVVVAAEMFGTTKYGIGWTLWLAFGWGNQALVFATMLTFGLIGLAMDICFRSAESFILRWRHVAR